MPRPSSRSSASLQAAPRATAVVPSHHTACIRYLPRDGKNKYTGHPVVLLTEPNPDGEVIFLVLTSFGGKDLIIHHPNSLESRLRYLPIAPSPKHPDNGLHLTLLDPRRHLPRESYINTKDQRPIRLNALDPFLVGVENLPLHLSSDSYKKLIEYIGFSPPPRLPAPAISPPSTPPNRTTRIQDMTLEELLDEYGANVAARVYQQFHPSGPRDDRVIEEILASTSTSHTTRPITEARPLQQQQAQHLMASSPSLQPMRHTNVPASPPTPPPPYSQINQISYGTLNPSQSRAPPARQSANSTQNRTHLPSDRSPLLPRSSTRTDNHRRHHYDQHRISRPSRPTAPPSRRGSSSSFATKTQYILLGLFKYVCLPVIFGLWRCGGALLRVLLRPLDWFLRAHPFVSGVGIFAGLCYGVGKVLPYLR